MTTIVVIAFCVYNCYYIARVVQLTDFSSKLFHRGIVLGINKCLNRLVCVKEILY